MNPVAALLLPVSAVVLASTTVSAVPADPAQSRTRAAPQSSRPSALRAPPRAIPAWPEPSRSASPALRGQWAWPLLPPPTVVRPFVRPATKYGAGHRGVDLGGASGRDVLAVEAGTVTHVGRIAGRGTVTVLHSSGIRSTYEPVDAAVTTGTAVTRGDLLGRLEESGSHCGTAACLHLGAIRGETYLDPLLFIVGGRRVRLLPLGQVPEG